MILAALIFGLRLAVILIAGAILAFLLNSLVSAYASHKANKDRWRDFPRVFLLDLSVELIGLAFPLVTVTATLKENEENCNTMIAVKLRKVHPGILLAHGMKMQEEGEEIQDKALRRCRDLEAVPND